MTTDLARLRSLEEMRKTCDEMQALYNATRPMNAFDNPSQAGLENIAMRLPGFVENVRAILSLLDQITTAPAPWPALDDDLAEILGRPNFMCGQLARAFRASGATIPTKAEAEQAFVIHWLTGLYLKHGKPWREFAAKDIEAVIRALPAPPDAEQKREGE